MLPVVWVLLALLIALAAIALLVVVRRRRLAAPRPDDAGAPRYPLVLAHGILGFDEVSAFGVRPHYFRGITSHLERQGITVYRPRVSPTASVPARAAQLAAFIKELPHERVNIVAHSMGGLDARFAISHLGVADRVASLITLGTPHRGTPVADLSEAGAARLLRGLSRWLGLNVDGFAWLTRERLAAFNADTPDAPEVFYGSVICTTRMPHPMLAATNSYLRRRHGSNDGLVTEASQQWGHRLFSAQADHWGQVGWSNGYPTTALYDGIVRELRARDL